METNDIKKIWEQTDNLEINLDKEQLKSIIMKKNKKSKIDVIVDRIVLKEDSHGRLMESLENATKLSKEIAIVEILGENHKEIVFSESFACPLCEFSLPELEPRTFSFNAPYGACPECKGLGVKLQIDPDLIIENKEFWNLI